MKDRNTAHQKPVSNLTLSICLQVATILFWISVVILKPESARSADPQACATLFTAVWTTAERRPATGAPTRFARWDRARTAIESAPNETLENIFSAMSKSDLDDLFWGIKSGLHKVESREENMINQIWHMVEDLGAQTFWGATADRRATIQRALHDYDTRPRLIENAIGKTEVEILSRAISEQYRHIHYPNTKWSDRATRLLFPLLPQVESILEAGNSLRRRLQLISQAERPVREAFARYRNSPLLTDAELVELKGLRRNMTERQRAVRRDVEKLYGREISEAFPLEPGEFRIPDLARRARQIQAFSFESGLQLMAEKNLDVIERIIKTPLAERSDTHLQIRNRQFRRETRQKLMAYLAVTRHRSPERSELRVRSEWTVTVKHEKRTDRQWVRDVPDPQGNITRTEVLHDYRTTEYETQFPNGRDEVISVTYEEILNDRIDLKLHVESLAALPQAELRGNGAVSATNGKPILQLAETSKADSIRAQGEGIRRTEGVFRKQISDSIHLLGGITNAAYKTMIKSQGSAPELLATLERERDRLSAVRGRLVRYIESDADAIKRQWPNDKEGDFRDRNRALLDLYDHMIKRIEHLSEQVRRATPTLTFEHTVPDYEPQLALLRDGRDKAPTAIRDSAVGAALIGVSAASRLSDLTSSFGP